MERSDAVGTRPLEWTNKRLPSTILCLLAVVLFGFFGYQEWSAGRELQVNGVRTEATVTHRGFDGVMVTFAVADSSITEVQLQGVWGDPKVGDRIPIIYDPADPSHNTDERQAGDMFIPILEWAGAALFLVLAGLTWARVVDREKIYRAWK